MDQIGKELAKTLIHLGKAMTQTTIAEIIKDACQAVLDAKTPQEETDEFQKLSIACSLCMTKSMERPADEIINEFETFEDMRSAVRSVQNNIDNGFEKF